MEGKWRRKKEKEEEMIFIEWKMFSFINFLLIFINFNK
jgi:hypothetical protein